jgi:hypothetical protein
MWGARREKTLDITVTQTMSEEKWTLKGGLVWPWVNDLRANWMRVHRGIERRRCLVVLNELSSIDETGERMLRTMYNEGAQLVATNVRTKRLLGRLASVA